MPILREQTHRLDVIAVRQEVRAHDALRLENFAVGKHARGRDDLDRQLRERRHVSRGGVGIGHAADGAEQHLQRLPARRQRDIDVDGGQIRLDGGAGVPRQRCGNGHVPGTAGCSGDEASRTAPRCRAPRESGRANADSPRRCTARRGFRALASSNCWPALRAAANCLRLHQAPDAEDLRLDARDVRRPA